MNNDKHLTFQSIPHFRFVPMNLRSLTSLALSRSLDGERPPREPVGGPYKGRTTWEAKSLSSNPQNTCFVPQCHNQSLASIRVQSDFFLDCVWLRFIFLFCLQCLEPLLACCCSYKNILYSNHCQIKYTSSWSTLWICNTFLQKVYKLAQKLRNHNEIHRQI